MACLSLSHLDKSFGPTPVLKDIDCEIRAGEFLVILGPSGCGKSTLLRMIAGLEPIATGEIRIDDQRVNTMSPRQRNIAMVFQSYALYPHYTVAENIGYALKLAGMPRAERAAKVLETAQMLNLETLLERRPAELSGGQRQRVAIGRAMVRDPSVFLFDEPLSNLDAKLRGRMRSEIRELHERLGATSVFVTHDQVEAMALADRIMVLNAGRIEQLASPRDIYERPASLFVADFVGSPPMNFLPARAEPNGLILEIGTEIFRLPGRAPATAIPLTAGIRPDHLRVVSSSSERGFSARIVLVEDLGAGFLLHCMAGGTELRVFSDTAPVRGTEISLTLDRSKLHLFDTATELRIDDPFNHATHPTLEYIGACA